MTDSPIEPANPVDPANLVDAANPVDAENRPGSAEPAKSSAEPRRQSTQVLKLISAMLAVVLVGLVAVSVFELRRAHTAHARASAEKAAAAAAVVDFPKIASYSYATIDADMARAAAVFTPSLRKEYPKIFGGLLATLQQQKVTVAATVQQAQSIATVSTRSVLVLVYFTQRTTPAKNAAGLTSRCYALTMSKVKGTWLIGAANAPA